LAKEADGEHIMANQQVYEIRVEGQLDALWLDWFEGLTLCHESEGISVLKGQIADQAALHGLLGKIRDLGLPLVSVRRVEPENP
jgi:hypothetical protein